MMGFDGVPCCRNKLATSAAAPSDAEARPWRDNQTDTADPIWASKGVLLPRVTQLEATACHSAGHQRAHR